MHVLEGTTNVGNHHVTRAKLRGCMAWLECPFCHHCPPLPSAGSESRRLTAPRFSRAVPHAKGSKFGTRPRASPRRLQALVGRHGVLDLWIAECRNAEVKRYSAAFGLSACRGGRFLFATLFPEIGGWATPINPSIQTCDVLHDGVGRGAPIVVLNFVPVKWRVPNLPVERR